MEGNREKQSKKMQLYLNKAKNLCSKQEKCKSDILKKFEEWNTPPVYYDRIIEILINEKYIDEERYSSSFVRSKFRQNKWGKIKIRYTLLKKDIPNEVIEEAINDEIPEDAYEECLHQLLEIKNHSFKGGHKIKKLSKLISFGTNKGFEYEIVKSISENILAE